MRVRVSNYRDRRVSEDPQARMVEIGPITVWFSYTTPVAFQVSDKPRVVHQNDWSRTTGAHLNEIDGGSREAKAQRVDGETFSRLMNEQIGRFFFPRDLVPDCPVFVVADWLRDRGLDRAADAVEREEMTHTD
jgi:hypothetical protein